VAIVISALPYMGRSLPHIVLTIVSQLCRNIEQLASLYSDQGSFSGSTELEKVPADHVATMLENLTIICHYCILDSTQRVSIGTPMPTDIGSIITSGSSATQIIGNLIHVFNPIGGAREPSPPKDAVGGVSPVMEARRRLL
ncbi:unnamed protein product, partial [Owenia fusiformis]